MSYLIAILVVTVLVTIYIVSYTLNKKVKEPENCKKVDCFGCNLNCKRRDENNE